MEQEKSLLLLLLLLVTCLLGTGIGCVNGTQSCPWVVPGMLGDVEDEKVEAQASFAFGWSLVTVSMALLGPILFCLFCKSNETKWKLRQLYLQRFLSAWGDRMWQLALPIILIDMFKDTLLPTSVYVMTVYIVVVSFLPRLGTWIDSAPRLKVQQLSLTMENVCVLFACVIICIVTALAKFGGNEDYQQHSLDQWQVMVWFVCLIVLGCAGELFNNTLVVSMDKDWVVVIARESRVSLDTLNTWMRRIDLVCKTLSPLVFATLYQIYGDVQQRRIFYGSITVGLWNLLSWPIEMVCVRKIYQGFSSLALKRHIHENGVQHSHVHGHKFHYHLTKPGTEVPELDLDNRWVIPTTAVIGTLSDRLINPTQCIAIEEHNAAELCHNDHLQHDEERSCGEPANKFEQEGDNVSNNESFNELALTDENVIHVGEPQETYDWLREEFLKKTSQVHVADGVNLVSMDTNTPKANACTSFIKSFKVYWQQPVFLASFAYTMLYMTVLDNGALMTSYLVWSGVQTVYLGVGRGMGAIMGILGTFLYPLAIEKLCGTVERTGLFSLWLFWLHVAPVAIFVFVDNGSGNVLEIAMIVCVAASRTWLWMFDLAITELVQVSVAEEDRGIFGAAQTASYQIFFILVHVAGIILSDPYDFPWLVLGAVLVVLASCILYTLWYLKTTRATNTTT